MAEKDIIVIGAGIAGLTASKLAAQQGFSTLNIESVVFGGLVLNINELDGEPHGSGAEYSSTLLMEITELGVDNANETVTGLERRGGAIAVITDQGRHEARAVIIASGARIKKLGVPGEAEFEHQGVATCADCDGPMYQGQTVVVVGGGDSALQEALVLAGYAKDVHLLHRGSSFRAQQHLVDAVASRPNIKVSWNSVVEQILGSEGVSGVRVRSNGGVSEIACTGVFCYPGLAPNSAFLPAEVQRSADGLVITDAAMQTGMKGVLAIGAVRSGYGGMLEDAITDATTAAASLKKLLAAI